MEKMGKTVRLSIILVRFFYREKLFICFSGTNELQFVFRTGKDGRDGINGDVPIVCRYEAKIFITLMHCGICKES